MSRRSLKEFSFGYSVPSGGQRKADDGANELIEIDLYEIGPTLKGMNPATELHSVKSAASDDYDAMRREAHDHFSALLTDASEATAPADRSRASSTGQRPAGCAASATASAYKSRSGGTTT
jgi:hypothetical protein